MVKISGLLKLMRPLNCLVMSFAVLVGVLLAGSGSIQWLNLLYGGITAFTLAAAAMVINDYYDYDIDKINEPNRPIPSGAVSKNAALIETGVLTVIGLFAAYAVSLYCFIFAVGAWVIMAAYSTVGKRSGLAGNFLVSACVAAPFLYGSLIALDTITTNVLLFASMAFLSNTGREIAKGIVDVQGDRSYHIKTMAVRFGEVKAALTAAFFFVFAVCLTATSSDSGYSIHLVCSLRDRNRRWLSLVLGFAHKKPCTGKCPQNKTHCAHTYSSSGCSRSSLACLVDNVKTVCQPYFFNLKPAKFPLLL